MRTIQLAAQARYVVTQTNVTIDDVWGCLIAPLETRYKSWHPSYGDFEPVAKGPDGRIREFELRGTSGGRYPLKIEKVDSVNRFLRLWRGPSKNPPPGFKDRFIGLIYRFEVLMGMDLPIVDIGYREDWFMNRGLFARRPSFEHGPQQEIRWIFGKFPIGGRIDCLRECEPSLI